MAIVAILKYHIHWELHLKTMQTCVLVVESAKFLTTFAGWVYLPSDVSGFGCKKGQISSSAFDNYVVHQ